MISLRPAKQLPVALEGRLCLSGKPHEYKRSLVWLNLPDPAKLGIPRARWPPLSISILQRRQGYPPPNRPNTLKENHTENSDDQDSHHVESGEPGDTV